MTLARKIFVKTRDARALSGGRRVARHHVFLSSWPDAVACSGKAASSRLAAWRRQCEIGALLLARRAVGQQTLTLVEYAGLAATARRNVEPRINRADRLVLRVEDVFATDRIELTAALKDSAHLRLQVAQVKRYARRAKRPRFLHEELGTRCIDEVDRAADEQQMSDIGT